VIRDSVASSTVASVGYDAGSQTLEVEFLSGSVYQYYNVTEGTYDEFMRAASKGQFIHVYLKNAYPYSKVA
jgi:hypothetical protein